MPDDRSGGLELRDTAREELLRAAAEALCRLAPDLPPDAAELLRRLHAALPTAELAAESPESLAAAAASLWSFAAERTPRTAKVRILPPGPGRGPRAVAEIVTDDMPFLVDTALAALSLRGRTVQRLLHPVVPVRRDPATGRLLAIDPAAPDRESMMRITLAGDGPAAAGEGWDGLEAALRRAMGELRAAVEDFPAMLARLREAEAELAAAPPPAPDREGAALEPAVAREFLRWLAEENFVLLGHRRFAVSPTGGLAVVEAENLGLLRDPAVAVFDVLRDLSAVPPAVRAALLDPAAPLAVAKANMRSSVHRPQHADVVATRIYGAGGRVAGARLFLGLFAASAYNRNPRSIPLLREKTDRILAMAGVDPNSHDGRAMRNILDTWPRDELFQAPEAEILAGARRALDLQIHPRTALVLRRDPFGRFVSAIAWLPRDTFDTRLRERVGAMLARAHEGRLSANYVAVGDAPLARVHYIIATVPGRVPAVDAAALEAAVAQAARGFRDRLAEALAAEAGEAEAARLLARWREAFPPTYREVATAAQGVADLHLAERALAAGRPAARIERAPGAPAEALTLRVANPGGAIALADALPLFESLDLRAIEEVAYRLTPADAAEVVLHVFALRAAMPCGEERDAALLEALAALQEGRADADGFNRLVLRAGLTWQECRLLRAMFRWLKQVGFPFAQPSVEQALSAHPGAARILVDLFHARFDPARPRDPAREAALEAAWEALLAGVENPDEDRILSRLMTLARAVLRSNFHQGRDYLALKIDSARAGDMPAPRPWREIFVLSPRMEGCHLRAGPVARGGIRWSDRREDFRTEILGLMKAQVLKNVVIVPTGAKGGFVLRRPPPATDREAFQAEGVACYRTLIRAMLDLTDNILGDRVVTPEGIVRRDGDDPYIVAAADKGTASFSDIANAIAAEYGFWLGDAFASGGSAGYDHKRMGITARGAWVMIERHFREALGRGVHDAPFTCVGVGDMSGDVFGNGMLISRRTRLLAAFDHRHIFVDPDPDPELSYQERARLFALPRSSWADYDPAKLSPGGGVHPRSAKTVPLSPEARALLGIEEERPEPAAVIRAILRAPVDLLYFGGIGTYVKASTESHAEVGDRANDAVRVDGRDLRARVVGEGANLGVTQAGRVEYARLGAGGQGGRINTDALDNSAGVSTSDHEVNIKILLADAMAEGVITRRQRDELLAAMTDEVAALVLRDNHRQSLAISLEALPGAEELPAQAALIARLEAEGLLDRAVAGLPDAAALGARITAGQAFTRPELAALLPFAKLWLTDAIAQSALPDDPALEPLLLAYFPAPLREARFARFARRHRLRRELIATILANAVANRLGCAALGRLTTEAAPAAAARAAWLADAAFGLEAAAEAIDAAPAPAGTRLAALLALRRLQEAAARELLAAAPDAAGPLAEAVAMLRPGVAALTLAEAARADAAAAGLREAGLPAEPAALVAAAPRLAAAPAIVRLADLAGVAPAEAAAAWGATGEAFALDALRAATAAARAPGAFGARAKAALLDELTASQMRLALARLRGKAPDPGRAAAAARLAREAAGVADLAAVTVASRALAALA
ncbi:glutamate dehydrogenase [Caldovatus sediminis]|uniref:Glutamate dehydrogenase n=1 Tax=Caldovatus sediminis TaxID=2041189 RepID=A0A8J2ZB41_9PROT|nr:NAD-glutamate dehydrogenase domain-containing protein [Caldovatus sediminis]GGG32812.1 glutamate dehydrogenase [Caldovatus sediminis]